MSAPRTLVTGGTGFVGRFVVESLIGAGHAVTVLGRHPPPDGYFSAPVAFSPLSLESDRARSADLAGADFFVHAAFDHVPGRYRGGEGDDPEGFRQLNLDGTIALFEAAKLAGVKRVVFLSSRAVYGTHPPGTVLDETMTPVPDTLYGEVKRAAEEALASMSEVATAAVSLRVTGVYGPAGPNRDHKWAELFADYLAGRSVVPRAGTEVHGRDLAGAVRLVLEAPAPEVSAKVFNVSDVLVDRRDILAIVKRVTGCIHPLPAPAGTQAINVMATGKIAALGWRSGGMALFEETVAELATRPAHI